MQSFLCIVTDAGEVHQLQQQQCIIQTQRNPWETNDATSPTAKSSATFNACPNSWHMDMVLTTLQNSFSMTFSRLSTTKQIVFPHKFVHAKYQC